MLNEIPIEDSYWVIPGRLLAGEYPGSANDSSARARLRWLLSQNVSLCLDLTETGEYDLKPYASLLQDEASRLGKAVEHIRWSIADMSVPSRQYMTRILNELEGKLQEQHTIYLHCYGGIGRTGTVVGCYLARLGMPGAQAIAQIAAWRQGLPDGWRESPETPQQREQILNWQPGE
jgi:protein-tyrosine phosphatase